MYPVCSWNWGRYQTPGTSELTGLAKDPDSMLTHASIPAVFLHIGNTVFLIWSPPPPPQHTHIHTLSLPTQRLYLSIHRYYILWYCQRWTLPELVQQILSLTDGVYGSVNGRLFLLVELSQ